jgi:tetratricopeptide (TPR) repeat protein
MSQGRFRDAFDFTERLLDEAPTGDFLLRGDIARLQHLGYRFALDFDASQRALDEATELYRRAGTIVEPANLVTNRSELLAWTDPLQAVYTAAEAIEVQSELGAFHELGKAYTALAIAQTRLGQHDEATVSFQTATEALERARYRSGRARAELFRAFLHARTSDVDAALASARWAVQELLVAEVYPSLIMMTGQFLETIGIADREITEAAHHACRQIQPLDSLTALRERTGKLVVDLLED